MQFRRGTAVDRDVQVWPKQASRCHLPPCKPLATSTSHKPARGAVCDGVHSVRQGGRDNAAGLSRASRVHRACSSTPLYERLQAFVKSYSFFPQSLRSNPQRRSSHPSTPTLFSPSPLLEGASTRLRAPRSQLETTTIAAFEDNRGPRTDDVAAPEAVIEEFKPQQ